MHNRATNIFNELTPRSSTSQGRWEVDRHPEARLFWLFAITMLPLILVAARVAYLQGFLTETYAQAHPRKTKLSFESIPSLTGRILGSDGRVLAQDVRRLNVQMHYRWLEEPADDAWLRWQAYAQLEPGERRNADLLNAAKQNVLATRKAMWQRLAQLTGQSSESLEERRAAIQRRVERMVGNVEQRQQQRKQDSLQASQQTVSPDADWWEKVWHTVVTTLTSSPERFDLPEIVLPEETEYYQVVDDVSLQVAAQIESRPEQYSGLRIRESTQRMYPFQSLASHIIGARTPFNNDDAARRKKQMKDHDPFDYQLGDGIGRSGVEKSYNRNLHGVRGQRRIVKNHRCEVIQIDTLRQPRSGRDVVLTLHLPLQEKMEAILDRALAEVDAGEETNRQPRGGAIVALDVRTGAVLVAVSAPRYDLGLMVNPDHDSWNRLIEDPRNPLFNRATEMTLPPGSVFKPLTSVAVIESGLIDPDAPFQCQGYLDKPSRNRCWVFRHHGVGHGETNLEDAICRSCNVYFFSAARQLGPGPIVKWARRFGFGTPTGIDIPGERGGNLPDPTNKSNRRNGVKRPPWYPGSTLQLGIGQATLTVTPLQVARMMAAVANGGYLVTPHVVSDLGPSLADTDALSLSARRAPHRIPEVAPETLERIADGLRKVVASRRGTGYKRVRHKQISIAGKTGTAEVGAGKQDHAWFAGFVPADQPRIAFAVVLEHAGSGSRAAGPVAHQLVNAMLEEGVLQPAQLTMRE